MLNGAICENSTDERDSVVDAESERFVAVVTMVGHVPTARMRATNNASS